MNLQRTLFAVILLALFGPQLAYSQPPDFILKWGSLGILDGEFIGPTSVAVNDSGEVFVTDRANNRIQKFTGAGDFILAWGDTGTATGEFMSPVGIALDAGGNVYVTDRDNNRVQKFTDSGAFLAAWGDTGSASGEFNAPSGVAVDAGGNIYVADSDNYRIQKFNSAGAWVASWGDSGSLTGEFDGPTGVAWSGGNLYVTDRYNHRVQKFTDSGGFVAAWGDSGTADGQFDNPFGIAVTSGGDVYVTDAMNHRIQEFSTSGVFQTKWGQFGSANGFFFQPSGVAVGPSGDIFIADFNNNRIQRFGTVVTTPGQLSFLHKWGSIGSAPGAFNRPYGVDFDSSGTVFYVADAFNHRVQKFNKYGLFLLEFGSFCNMADSSGCVDPDGAGPLQLGDGQFYQVLGVAVDANGDIYVSDNANHRIQKFDANGNFLFKFGSEGPGDGQLKFPRGLAIDSAGNIFVAGNLNQRIQKFDANGNYITKWGSFGTSTGKFQFPRGLDVDTAGNVYVADRDNHRIQVFDNNGSFLFTWGSNGSQDGKFENARDVAIGPSGDVFVTDELNHRIQRFTSAGAFLAKWGNGPLAGDGEFNRPLGIAVNPCEQVYVADKDNRRIQAFGEVGVCFVNTLTGTNVEISLPPNVVVKFATVTSEGQTDLTLQSSGPVLPPGILIVPASPPVYYDIVSTATYTGPVEVRITYNPGNVQGSPADLLLFHYDQTLDIPSWRNVTTSVDTVAAIVTGAVSSFSTFVLVEPGNPTGIGDESGLPRAYKLFHAFPNPFNQSTRINFNLPEPSPVTLQIFDLSGRLVDTLVQTPEEAAGRHSVLWDARNSAGQQVAPGIYFYRLKTRSLTDTRKLVLVR